MDLVTCYKAASLPSRFPGNDGKPHKQTSPQKAWLQIEQGILYVLTYSIITMCQHANLISSLTEFYTLLVQLAVLDPSQQLIVPDADAIVNLPREAALSAGFCPEAIDLISQLPYLTVGISSIYPEIQPSTMLIHYYTECKNEGVFEGLRSMDDDPYGEENLIPGHSFRLTLQELYGTSLIYNTETGKMTMHENFGMLGFRGLT